jgi:hypothetical protein
MSQQSNAGRARARRFLRGGEQGMGGTSALELWSWVALHRGPENEEKE